MAAEWQTPTYTQLMACFDVLKHHTGARMLINLADLVWEAVTENDLRAKVRDLARRRRIVRRGRGQHATYALRQTAGPGQVVRLKKDRSARRWDGTWSVLTYDIPVSMNSLRQRLARVLHQMGFACLSGSCWLSPYDWLDFLAEMFSRWRCGGVVSYMRSGEVVPLVGDAGAGPGTWWDLADVREGYERIADRCDKAPRGNRAPARRARARICIAAAQELAQVESDDPMLPPELLPKTWPRPQALSGFEALRKTIRREIGDAGATGPSSARSRL